MQDTDKMLHKNNFKHVIALLLENTNVKALPPGVEITQAYPYSDLETFVSVEEADKEVKATEESNATGTRTQNSEEADKEVKATEESNATGTSTQNSEYNYIDAASE